MEDIKIIETLAIHETKLKDMDKRLEHCEETTKSINTLAQSIAKMDITLENTNETVKELKDNVSELKDKPSKRWDLITTTIISGMVGYIISSIV